MFLEKDLDKNIRLQSGELLFSRREQNYISQSNAFGQKKDKEDYSIKIIKMGHTSIRLAYTKNDKNLSLKVYCLRNAVNRLKKCGIDLPNNIRITICTKIDESYSFNGLKDSQVYPHIYLGKNLLEYNPPHKEFSKKRLEVFGGVGYGKPRIVADHIYDKSLIGKKISNRASAHIIHEFGHSIHEIISPQKYYELCDMETNKIKGQKAQKILSRRYDIGCKVSEYAQRNSLEYIAEVFSGLVFGKKYDKDIMAFYNELGGPKVDKKIF